MDIRTTRSTLTLRSPFRVRGQNELCPAGEYDVEIDEEIIEGNGRTVYRRVATLILIKSAGLTRTASIEPAELTRALGHEGESGT